MSDVLLTFESVEIRRGMSIVVSDFSLRVSSAEVVVLHGENGCGKSTIIEAAARILPIEKGQILQHEKINSYTKFKYSSFFFNLFNSMMYTLFRCI